MNQEYPRLETFFEECNLSDSDKQTWLSTLSSLHHYYCGIVIKKKIKVLEAILDEESEITDPQILDAWKAWTRNTFPDVFQELEKLLDDSKNQTLTYKRNKVEQVFMELLEDHQRFCTAASGDHCGLCNKFLDCEADGHLEAVKTKLDEKQMDFESATMYNETFQACLGISRKNFTEMKKIIEPIIRSGDVESFLSDSEGTIDQVLESFPNLW